MAHKQYSDCIEACLSCAEACDRCVEASRNDPNPAMLTRCNALCMDCAAMCRLTVGYMTRDSEFVDLICQDCAEICESCVEECMRFQDQDEAYRQCTDACHKCMEECLKMGTMPFKPSSLMNGRSYNLRVRDF